MTIRCKCGGTYRVIFDSQERQLRKCDSCRKLRKQMKRLPANTVVSQVYLKCVAAIHNANADLSLRDCINIVDCSGLKRAKSHPTAYWS